MTDTLEAGCAPSRRFDLGLEETIEARHGKPPAAIGGPNAAMEVFTEEDGAP